MLYYYTMYTLIFYYIVLCVSYISARSSLQVTPLASQRVRMRLGSSAYAEVLTAELLGVTGWGLGGKKNKIDGFIMENLVKMDDMWLTP